MGREHLAQRAHATPPMAAGEQAVDGSKVEEAQPLGVLDGPLELTSVEHLGEVEQRPREGGHRDAVSDCPVVGVEGARAVDAQAATLVAAAPHGSHIDGRGAALSQTPQMGGIAVAENRARTAREYGGHPAATQRELRAAGRVNALVNGVETPRLDRAADRSAPEAEPFKLVMSDDPVLAVG